MSNGPEIPSYASTEHIDGDDFPDQQRSHGPSESLATEGTQIAPISTATFNTPYNAGTVTNVNGNINNIYYENSQPTAPAYAPRLPVLDIHPDPAVRARFDCKGRTPCTERTRIDVIEKIDTWTDTGPPVFWLNGSAGTGKSTIAYTVAKGFKGRGILGASFFCSRDDATCSNHKLIFPSIAHQLAHFHPEFRRQHADVMKEQPDIVHSDVAYQLQELIVEPLGSIRDFPPGCVVVIDALDECKDDSTISVILAALSSHVDELASLKIFLTSRPERNIKLGFSDSVMQGATRRFILHEIQLSTVEADIKTYIIAQLEIVRREYEIDQSWPSGAEVDSLSTLSCGLFIFAATAIKFIQDHNYANPQKQLTRIILNTAPLKDEDSDLLHHLDLLYLQVLMNAHPKPSSDLAERLRLLLGTIVLLQDPLSIRGIQQLLKHQLVNRFEVQSIRQTLVRLHSIILVPDEDDDIIRTLHPSFFDFITSPNRCSISQLLVDTSQQHTVLLAACLRTMQGLKRNICELPDPSVLNNEIADLPSRIAKFIPPAQQYACRHWGTHLQYAVISEDVWKQLLRFCSEHMLFWVEACSLLGDLRNQLVLLDVVQRTLAEQVHKGSAAAAMTLLHDCERLIREFFPAVSTAWAHVYDSALNFSPQRSALRKCYSPQLKVMGGPKEWNVCSRIIEGHSSWLSSVAYSPDGTRIASGSNDRTIRLWDTISGAHLNTLEGHSSAVLAVAFSPDGVIMASGSHDKTIRLWDTVSGKHLVTLEGHTYRVRSVAYSPDGTRIASGSNDRTIRLWDAISGAHLNTLKGHSSAVCSVAFSPDGTIIASGSEDETIRLWDTVSGKHLVTLEGHTGPVRLVKYSPDGTRIASGSQDHSVRLWDAISGTHLNTLKGHSSIVFTVAFSPNRPIIASGSADKTIRLWDAVSGKHLVTLEGHSGHVRSVSFSPEGTRIASGSIDQTIRLWITGHDLHPKMDGKNASLVLSAFSRFKIARSLARRTHISDANSLIVSFSPDASVVISVSLDGLPILWDAASGAHLMTLKGHSDRVNAVVFSHNGTRILSASDDKTVRMWDTGSGVTVKTLEGHRKPVLSVTFSPDGTRIASGSENGTIRLWDAFTGAHAMTLEGRQERVMSLKFSPEGTRIASGSGSHIRLWDVLCGSPLATIEMAPESRLGSMAFSPDGNYLVVVVSYGEQWGLQLRALFSDGEVLKAIKWHEASPALWLPFSSEHRDLTTVANYTRQWARACGSNGKYNYFVEDGWVWFFQPRRRLCWVPVTFRGERFVSSNTRIAFGTKDLGIVIIDFSDILGSSSEDQGKVIVDFPDIESSQAGHRPHREGSAADIPPVKTINLPADKPANDPVLQEGLRARHCSKIDLEEC
ncbi:WD40 repeat-like protein [Athelia psychrophila]|uniref:WD40 repeat-like protein n=1 Tax=Athelia psychrophila TaxID=1759441 RepID=A0A166TJL9_9AGAM|nr:WD40 repeat-like protein [Fibularhizoctonia sp. CBS 109695]